MIICVDDINMPSVEEYGAQPPIELLRLISDKEFIYDRKGLEMKKIKETVILACSAPPGGGRNNLTPRFTRHFNILNLTQPNFDVLQKIFETMLDEFCIGLNFPDQIKKVNNIISKKKILLN